MKALIVAGALLLGACQPRVVEKIVEVPAPKSDYQSCVERVKENYPRAGTYIDSYILRFCGPAGGKP